MKYVLDSNILISAMNINDVHNEEASTVIDIINKNRFEILAPVLYLWEMEAYLRHSIRSEGHKQNTNIKFKVTTLDVTSDLFSRTYKSDLACIKGADRVFVSVAIDQKCPLITNDKQIHKYSDIFGIESIYTSEFVKRKF